MPSLSLFAPDVALEPRRSPEVPPADRLLRESRAGVALLLVLAVANGLFLYLLPGRAAFDYAWSIKPSASAAFLGAGYLAGTVATALVVFGAVQWRSLRILPLPLIVLSFTLLAATLIHADRFRWGYPPTWVWTAVYATIPFIVVLLWRRQEGKADPKPAADPRLRTLRILSAALGAVLLGVGIALYVAPVAMGDAWPWQLTPLLSRALGPWYLLVGTALATAAVSLRRLHEVPIGYATLLTWTALLMLLPVLHSGDMAGRSGAMALYLTVHALLLALAAYALWLTVPRMRQENQRL